MPIRPLARAAVLTLLLAAGCRDREITAYRSPKDPATTPPAPAGMANTNDLPPNHPPIGAPAGGDMMANTAVPTGSDSLTWTAPAGWAAMPQRPMRKATFAVKGGGGEADFSITSFPGDTGGLLANLNRWRGQIALPPLAGNQVDANVQHLDVGALHADFVDFAGTANGVPTRIIGAVVPHQGETWFFKLMGPDAPVASAKPEFMEFLKTVRPR